MDNLQIAGFYEVSHYRRGFLLNRYKGKNLVTNIGKNTALDILFRNQTQIATWYAGLIDNSGFTAIAAADTMASHSGWTEVTTYDEASRVTWVPTAAASQSITNSTTIDFTMNATKTLNGAFFVSNNTKGGTTGTLWSGISFASSIPVVSSDLIKLTYTVNM